MWPRQGQKSGGHGTFQPAPWLCLPWPPGGWSSTAAQGKASGAWGTLRGGLDILKCHLVCCHKDSKPQGHRIWGQKLLVEPHICRGRSLCPAAHWVHGAGRDRQCCKQTSENIFHSARFVLQLFNLLGGLRSCHLLIFPLQIGHCDWCNRHGGKYNTS